MLAKQGGLKPVFDQPLARPGDRVDTGLQRRRDLAIAPARTTLRGVSFQQDAGLQQLLCRMFPAMDKGGELLSFLIAECHDVLLYRDLFSGHEPAPSLVTEASRQKMDAESMTDTTSQIPVDKWYEVIGNPTYADAILDRLVHNAHRIDLAGDSLRRTRPRSAAKD